MYSRISTFFVALQVCALAALFVLVLPAVVTPALGSPLPESLLLPIAMRHYVDFTEASPTNGSSRSSTLSTRSISYELQERRLNSTTHRTLPQSIEYRDVNTILSNINILNQYSNGLATSSANFRSLAAQRPSQGSDVSSFQQQSSTEVSTFRSHLSGFSDIFAQLGSDKGLANYDKTDSLQTLLKNVVNANKNILSTTDQLVYQVPAVGGTLGPLVYDIKCILDEILNAVENMTDGILNDVKPLLQGVISSATNTACNSGLKLAGLCLLM